MRGLRHLHAAYGPRASSCRADTPLNQRAMRPLACQVVVRVRPPLPRELRGFRPYEVSAALQPACACDESATRVLVQSCGHAQVLDPMRATHVPATKPHGYVGCNRCASRAQTLCASKRYAARSCGPCQSRPCSVGSSCLAGSPRAARRRHCRPVPASNGEARPRPTPRSAPSWWSRPTTGW